VPETLLTMLAPVSYLVYVFVCLFIYQYSLHAGHMSVLPSGMLYV